MNIFLLTAEHFEIPGLIQRAFHSELGADAEAAELVNLMVGDSDDSEVGEKPAPSTAANWDTALEWLQGIHGAAHCYVEVSSLAVL
jgi:hypothetical protein